jgi:hypothetical protein
LLRAMRHRPVVYVRFGDTPVDLSQVTGTPGARAMKATRLIMEGIDETLAHLRAGEMETPRYVDHTRAVDNSRVRPRPGRTLRPSRPADAPATLSTDHPVSPPADRAASQAARPTDHFDSPAVDRPGSLGSRSADGDRPGSFGSRPADHPVSPAAEAGPA